MTFERAKLALAILLVLAVCLGVRSSPAGAQGASATAHRSPGAPKLAAHAWVLEDMKSGEYLAGKNASRRLPMASTTKIMDALVALKEGNLGREVTVSRRAAAYSSPIYSNAGLRAGDTLSVRELLEAALIPSADDAAYALAQALGSGSANRFVAKMNREARVLGLKNTHFENPIGLDARGHYTSARDLATMTRLAFHYATFRKIVGTSYTTISTQNRQIPLSSTNELLSIYPPATGVKTGTTPKAGPCLVASATRGNESYVVVLLNDENRFPDAVKALDYAFATYDRRTLVQAGKKYASLKVPYRRNKTVGLVAKKSVVDLIEKGEDMKRKTEVTKSPPDSARRGEKLGEIAVMAGGRRVGESPLVAKKGYEEPPWWQKIWYTVQGFF